MSHPKVVVFVHPLGEKQKPERNPDFIASSGDSRHPTAESRLKASAYGMAVIEFGLSNARIEATNNKIKLLIRIAYGFRDIDTMVGLIMLFCSSIVIPRPGRVKKTPIE